MDLPLQRLFWMIPTDPDTWAYKGRELFLAMVKERCDSRRRVREIRKGHNPLLLTLKTEEGTLPGMWAASRRWKRQRNIHL